LHLDSPPQSEITGNGFRHKATTPNEASRHNIYFFCGRRRQATLSATPARDVRAGNAFLSSVHLREKSAFVIERGPAYQNHL